MCACPFGRAGPRCEEDALLTTPFFDGRQEEAYVAFKRPRHILRT